jgi:parallel beta-helix repeat protein
MFFIGKMSCLFLLLLLSVLSSERESVAATYYVAINGNDTNGDGSIGKPWLTVPKGIRSLHAGDTLFIRGGTYTINTMYGNAVSDTYGCNPTCPTSWATATSIRNYPGEAVVIKHMGFNMDAANYPNGLSYLIWQGDSRRNFVHEHVGTGCPTADTCPGNNPGLRINNAVHHVRMQTMTIRNFTEMGINGGNSSSCTQKPTDIEIIDNEIRNNGNEREERGPYEHGVYPSCGDRWTISRNYVVGNSAYGIHVNNSSVPNATNNFTIDRNIVEGRSSTAGGTTNGIVVTKGSGHVIINNIIIGRGSQAASLTVGIGVAYGVTGATIANNTVHNTTYGIQTISVSGITIRNNLMSAMTQSIDLHSSSNISVGNNLCPTSDPDGGCAVVTSTPGFIAPGSNFRLAAGSLAIDAGTSVPAVAIDHDGATRPKGGAYDIGAYEGDGASASAPSPPRNLSVR